MGERRPDAGQEDFRHPDRRLILLRGWEAGICGGGDRHQSVWAFRRFPGGYQGCGRGGFYQWHSERKPAQPSCRGISGQFHGLLPGISGQKLSGGIQETFLCHRKKSAYHAPQPRREKGGASVRGEPGIRAGFRDWRCLPFESQVWRRNHRISLQRRDKHQDGRGRGTQGFLLPGRVKEWTFTLPLLRESRDICTEMPFMIFLTAALGNILRRLLPWARTA